MLARTRSGGGKINRLGREAARSPEALANLIEAVFDGGGFTEESLFEARAALRVLIGHFMQQTRCLEIIARSKLKDPNSLGEP